MNWYCPRLLSNSDIRIADALGGAALMGTRRLRHGRLEMTGPGSIGRMSGPIWVNDPSGPLVPNCTTSFCPKLVTPKVSTVEIAPAAETTSSGVFARSAGRSYQSVVRRASPA